MMAQSWMKCIMYLLNSYQEPNDFVKPRIITIIRNGQVTSLLVLYSFISK